MAAILRPVFGNGVVQYRHDIRLPHCAISYFLQAVTRATPRDLRITLHAFQISASPYGDHTKDFAFEARVCVTVCVKGATVTHWKLKENGGMFCHCTDSVTPTR